MNTKACYRKLKAYKYQLMEDFVFETEIRGYEMFLAYLKIEKDGRLTVYKGYAWDGASGPTLDTQNAMRGSLVHDALYQLLRENGLPQDMIVPVDKLFRKIIRQDGMSTFRSWYWYQGLRLAKGKAAQKGTQKPDNIYCVPANLE